MSDREIKWGAGLLLLAVLVIFILAAQGGNDGPVVPVDTSVEVSE